MAGHTPSINRYHESERLEYLRSLGILDSPTEPEFDSLVMQAAQICQTSAAAITLVDDRRCYLKAAVGLVAGSNLIRQESFCGAFYRSSGIFELPDAWQIERFRSLPIASGPAGYRFYAGAPLVSATGHSLGTLCVLDHEPRLLDDAQRSSLAGLASEIVARLESRAPVNRTRPAATAETVLLVEDEESVRELTDAVLRQAGYQVATAANGIEGLALWKQHRDEIAVVLTDLTMPGMGGVELAQRLHAERAPPPIVVMSGNVTPAAKAALDAAGVMAIVAKPFLVETLVSAVTLAAAAR